MLTYRDIKNNERVRTYIRCADESLRALGYTEHSFAHVAQVAERAGKLLESLGYDGRQAELARIAGFLHDIGNLVNRVDHSQSGAILAFRLLEDMGMDAEEIATVVTAIGNHDEGNGVPVNAVSAVLILADKSDVRRTRVRDASSVVTDIHDRVNYSVTSSELVLNEDKTSITLCLTVDTAYGSLMDYFEIFMERMLLCRKAANALGLAFHLIMNGQVML
ncbi:MAG: HD domain-containing protein [Ruminococcaceae bacterium]|nr:HD domain-containing protein [Oscillospiraceae bacterium]